MDGKETSIKVTYVGNFNGWKGNICLYFPKKKVRELKRYGITEEMDIKQAYLKVSNIKNI